MNSKQTIKIWSRVVTEACEGKTLAEQKKVLVRLEEILKAKKKSYLMPKIVANAAAALQSSAKLEITLAHAQSPELAEKLKKRIASAFEAGSDAKVLVDPAIIGGFVAKSSQYLMDASVKNFLQRLKNKFDN
ncbi:MAG: F0F1 ATP synthase subunit delta [Candidatus Pacebacteria bacterium]|jgi:F0F1-type ATP synthase delta subunit|nr:F0F1 ATP synthase subunit delta [Candidatus Paceibacterota bacterium]